MADHRTAEQIEREQHVDLTTGDGAERALIIGFDGTSHVVIKVDPDGNLKTVPAQLEELPFISEDTDFVSGDSPATLDINTFLGRNCFFWEIINDGPGSFTVALSNNGSSFGNEATVKQQEIYRLPNISVDSIRITHISDSAYRVRAI